MCVLACVSVINIPRSSVQQFQEWHKNQLIFFFFYSFKFISFDIEDAKRLGMYKDLGQNIPPYRLHANRNTAFSLS